MSLPPITVIPAGAGSGKTFTVQERLGEWVNSNKVLPERIVAVTFTEAAAGELRERIRAKLLELKRTEDALKLDQAYISTIHGFGLKILTEFAFESGLTPQPRLLNEDEQSALIRHSLAHTTKVKEIIQNLSSYGYTFNFQSKKSPEDVFRKDILDIITMLRSMGWQQDSTVYAEQAVEWIREHYGNPLKGDTLNKELHQRVLSLLKHFPESLADMGTTPTSTKDLKNNYRDLKKAADLSVLSSDWSLWARLRKLRVSNRGCKLTEEYDELAQQVMDAADQLPFHPGPLSHASGHIEALLAAGQEVLLHYSEAKREAGLVDYSDMIALAYKLINENPDVLDTLVQRIDCLVVDEFQDTNPLQFSLLWKLKEAGVPTLIVGDLKQAIMGFQGADARLFHALEKQFPDDIKPLNENWRSQPPLMDFVNAIGPVLFEQAYTKLTPRGGKSELQPLEIVDFPKKNTKDMHRIRAAYVGKRIKALLEAGDQYVIDRRTKKKRLLQGGDIAVLAPSWNILGQTAEVYRALGLKVKLKEDGWSESREVQIAIQALAYVANPADKHAALYLAVTELGQLTLHEALKQLMDNGVLQDPLLAKLDGLAETISDQTIYTMVADTLNCLGFFDIVSLWPNAQQARANLLRLQAESSEYMDASREVLANGGFYGSGIQSFLAWLNDKIDDNDKQPAPQVIDENAIEMVTFHSSKGREWPVVVVAGMDTAKGGKLPDLGLGYDSFEDLSKLLDNTHVEYSPKFSASESNDKFLSSLDKTAKEVTQRLMYVALTRARDKLIIEWPSYLQGKPAGSYWSLLTDEGKVSIVDDNLQVQGEKFPCKIHVGKDFFPDDIDLELKVQSESLPTTGRRAICPGKVANNIVPDSISPSTLKDEQKTVDNNIELTVEKYSDALQIESDLPARELGTSVHELFEIFGKKPDVSLDIVHEIYGSLNTMIIEQVAKQVYEFESWIVNYYSPDNIYRELPFMSINHDGSVVNGTADLVLKTKQGVVVIDHKTDKVSDSLESFEKYLPQLMTYANELSKEIGTVVTVGIHWIRNGELVLCKLT